jgi:hypothetical protein
MRKYIEADAMSQAMKLMQLGATVTKINSKTVYVQFDLEGLQLEYVYNLNAKGKFFLERIKPYPLPIKVYDAETDIVEVIEIDVDQFSKAVKSHNIDSFIAVNLKLNELLKKFEDLFLYYNVSSEKFELIHSKLDDIRKEIEITKENSTRLYYRKNPENL